MEKAKRRDTYTAILFLAGLIFVLGYLFAGLMPKMGGFAAVSKPGHRSYAETQTLRGESLSGRNLHAMRNHLAAPPPDLSGLPGEIIKFIDTSEKNLNTYLDRDFAFIELYGGAQRLMGRSIIEDPDPQYTVVRLTDEVLGFVNLDAEPVDMEDRAREMIEFARRVRKECDGVHTLYIQAPSKLTVFDLPEGLTDYSNDEADQFLSILEDSYLVDTLDLRPAFREAVENGDAEPEELFFRTDHHWTPQGAFLGFQTICEKLKADYGFNIEKEWVRNRSYTKTYFDGFFLGSMAKRVGSLYAGMDGLEIWSPTFATNFTYTVPLSGIKREGSFATTLLFPERLVDTNYYIDNPYSIYSGDDYLLARAVNHNNPDAPRLLILRDSFGCALTPFLAIASSEMMAVEPRAFNSDQDYMIEYINWLDPDLIIVINTTSSLRVDNLYPYLPTGYENKMAALQSETEESPEDISADTGSVTP